MASWLLRESGAQHPGSAKRFECGVCGVLTMFQRKVLAGQIKIPITRLEPSQKSAKGIHITDMAIYLDQQRDSALKELRQLNK